MTNKDLIERLEASTGPDRDLDFLVWKALYGDETAFKDDIGDGQFLYRCKYNGPVSDIDTIRLPHLTASIDAAWSTIPYGWEWSMDNCMSSTPEQIIYRLEFGENMEVEHTSLPHAIIIASLKATSTDFEQYGEIME